MIARPSVLVLDEPTSGLDDYGARFTMKLVLEYVKSEMTTVIIVIHQPAEAVFNLFDRCLLLGKGRVAYFGETKTAGEYFSSMGHPTPPLMNPIEHYCTFETQLCANTTCSKCHCSGSHGSKRILHKIATWSVQQKFAYHHVYCVVP